MAEPDLGRNFAVTTVSRACGIISASTSGWPGFIYNFQSDTAPTAVALLWCIEVLEMGDKIELQKHQPAEKACSELTFWEKVGHTLHLTDKTCNEAVEAMRQPSAAAEKQVPNLMIEGVEAVQRSGRTGTINKQEAEMLKEI